MTFQGVPPPPPPPHPFDPNLIFLQNGEPAAWLVAVVLLAALAAMTIILWPLMRAFARRLEGKSGDPTLRAEVDQLHARVQEVDALHHRVAELEERVDFTERLLAQAQPQGRVGAPTQGSGR
jgi:Tfp pilus assembly protein PilO